MSSGTLLILPVKALNERAAIATLCIGMFPQTLPHKVPEKFHALTIMVALPRCAASYPPTRAFAFRRLLIRICPRCFQLTLPLAVLVEGFHRQVSAPRRMRHEKGHALLAKSQQIS